MKLPFCKENPDTVHRADGKLSQRGRQSKVAARRRPDNGGNSAVQGGGHLGGALRAGDQPAPQHVAGRRSRDPAGRHVHGVLRDRTGRLPLSTSGGMVSPARPSRRPVPGQRGTARLHGYRHYPSPPRQALGGVAGATRVAPHQQCAPRPRAAEPDPTCRRIAVPPLHGSRQHRLLVQPDGLHFHKRPLLDGVARRGCTGDPHRGEGSNGACRARFRSDPSACGRAVGCGQARRRSPWRR